MSSLAPDVLTWAAATVAPGAAVIGLREVGGRTGPRVLTVRSVRGVARVVLRTASADASDRLATEAAALIRAEEADFPAPRLLAHDPTGATAGAIAIVTTFVPGSSRIPRQIDASRLRALGRMAARLATVDTSERPGLPHRSRPLADEDFEQSALIRDLGPAPDGPTVLVHGDLWQGNTMWQNGEPTAFIDWEAAGVGHPGVDLGNLRCDAAILFGPQAADLVLDGWTDQTGERPKWVPYYDAVAAYSSPSDLSWFMPPIHGQGRKDLDQATAIARRDDFLHAALT